jgi:hypothetical protein
VCLVPSIVLAAFEIAQEPVEHRVAAAYASVDNELSKQHHGRTVRRVTGVWLKFSLVTGVSLEKIIEIFAIFAFFADFCAFF